jgi:hypothetical protein
MDRITLGSSVKTPLGEEALGEGRAGVAGGGEDRGGSEGVGGGGVTSCEGVGFQVGDASALGAGDGGVEAESLGAGLARKALHETARTDRTTRADRRITFL